MGKFYRLLLLIIALSVGITSHSTESQKREMRAAWIATVWRIDWPSTTNNANAQKAEIDAYLDELQSQNFNAVFFQVRSMCDAMYQSSYEPWSSYLTGTRGKNPGYDPLAYVVEQCHARGIQCHAWVNPYRVSTGSNWNTPQDQELKNSGMLLSYTSGSTTTTILNPGLPATRERIVNIIREIITNYNVDGVVFDDYFYPNGIPTTNKAEDYDLWNNSAVDMTFADWRRNNVNMMVRDVYNMIQQTKPEVRFGISPAGVAGASASQHGVTPCPKGSDWQYNGIFSDPLAWLDEGTIDYISPQIYWKTNSTSNPFGPITQWWSYIAKHFGRHHFASHSISFLAEGNNTQSDWAEIVNQINYSRQYTENNAPGAVLYSAKNINGHNTGVSGLGNYLLANEFQHPAMIPALTWKTAPGYNAPTGLAKDGITLTWDTQEGILVKYSVYAVPIGTTVENAMSEAFDGIKSDYLLGVTYDPIYKLPDANQNGYWYAVCVIDGYGNESEPAYLGMNPSTEVTERPVITSEITDDAVIITATGNGTVKLYIDGALVGNPYSITRGNSDITVVASATAQEEGKLISETVECPILVPARAEDPSEVTYNIEKVWEINNLSFLNAADTRQAFGMGGKFYINDKSSSTIYVVDQNGLTGTTYEGGSNCGLTRDQAGNLVVSNALFPDPLTECPEIKVIDLESGNVVTYTLPTSVINFGRSDYLGCAQGNMLEDGEIYLVGANSGTSVSRIAIADGEVDVDNSYLATCDGVTASNTTVLNYYTDLNGEPAVLYITRNAAPVKMTFDGSNFVGTSFSLPNKGACNGAYPFVWDNMELVVYPTLQNYRDGFAVAKMNADEPLVYVPQVATANANNSTNNWVNAEVIDGRNVNIYQYYPGGHITLWRLTKQGGGMRGDVNEDGAVNISDVTALINYLLGGSTDGINLDNANCNQDEGINISDVTTLISYLLSGTWADN